MHFRGTKGLRAFLIAISSGHVLSRELRFVRRVRGSIRSWIYTTADTLRRISPTIVFRTDPKRRSSTRMGQHPGQLGSSTLAGRALRKTRAEAVARILASIHKPIWNATDHTYYIGARWMQRRPAHKNLPAVRGRRFYIIQRTSRFFIKLRNNLIITSTVRAFLLFFFFHLTSVVRIRADGNWISASI